MTVSVKRRGGGAGQVVQVKREACASSRGQRELDMSSEGQRVQYN